MMCCYNCQYEFKGKEGQSLPCRQYFQSHSVIESVYQGVQDPSPRVVDSQKVNIDQNITLFPWVDAIEEGFIERVQPYWLTNKKDIIDGFRNYLQFKSQFRDHSLYLMFWGAFTCSILLYFANKASFDGEGLGYYLVVLLVWNAMVAGSLCLYSKVNSSAQIGISQHISTISNTFTIMVVPISLVACNTGLLKVFFAAAYLAAITWFITKNYTRHWKSSIGQLVIVSGIVGLCNTLQVYFLFFLSASGGRVTLSQVHHHHNIHGQS